MPDLITHLTFSYIICKSLKKKLSISFVLLGGVLPDLFTAIEIILVDILKSKYIEDIQILTMLGHSFFVGLLISLIIGLFFKPEKKYIISLFLGYSFHLLIDLLQNNWSNGIPVFYPFYFKPFSLNLFTYGVEFRYSFSFILLLFLFFMIFNEKETLILNFKIKKIFLSVGLILFLIILNFSLLNKSIESNIGFVDLKYHPKKYHNKIIQMNMIRLTSVNPVMVKFRGHNLLLKKVNIKLSKRRAYDLKGIFDYNNKSVRVSKIIPFIPFFKVYISGIGLIVLMFYFILRVKIRENGH